MKKIIIAGGGISGLVARYRLSQRYPDANIVLYEKSDRLGGCIETIKKPYFFERGPRTFKASRCQSLLDLIDELDLSKDLLYSSKDAKRRYLWKDGKLHALPIHPLGIFTSSIIRPFLPSLLKEWRQPCLAGEDESIASFVERRLGKYAAETFFDPLTLGIFAGDIHQLSIAACFPELKKMEQEFGSLTKALLKKKKTQKRKGLFTLKGGVLTLVDRLVERGKGEIHLNTPLESLDEKELVLALSAPAAASLFKNDPIAKDFFASIPSTSLTVVNVAYQNLKLNYPGFGYLVPTSEKEKVLGVVFDSSIFPQQNSKNETRLTVMLRHGDSKEALDAIKRHLGIQQEPNEVHVKKYSHAIPQYQIGHLKRVNGFEEHLVKHYPHITCLGNYLHGVSLNHCIQNPTQ